MKKGLTIVGLNLEIPDIVDLHGTSRVQLAKLICFATVSRQRLLN